MDSSEAIKIKSQLLVLQELQPIYSGKTLDNVITQLQARLKFNGNQ